MAKTGEETIREFMIEKIWFLLLLICFMDNWRKMD